MDKNYIKSNKILRVEINVSENAKLFAQTILSSSKEEERQKFSEGLLDELSDCAEIDIVNIKISSAKQYHKRKGNRIIMKQYGYYNRSTNYIYITNRTAVQGKYLAPKSFLDTLLHEWLHHYDSKKLGLNSIHCAGFYKRLNHLKEILGII